VLYQKIVIRAQMIPTMGKAKVKQPRHPTGLLFDDGVVAGLTGVTRELGCCGTGGTGLTGVTRELACCGTGGTGLSEAGLGAGIFFPMSSALLAGRTRAAGVCSLTTGVVSIFRATASALLILERPLLTGAASTAFSFEIFSAALSALLTRLRPVRSFIAISLPPC
jgi:hypothetical protein